MCHLSKYPPEFQTLLLREDERYRQSDDMIQSKMGYSWKKTLSVLYRYREQIDEEISSQWCLFISRTNQEHSEELIFTFEKPSPIIVSSFYSNLSGYLYKRYERKSIAGKENFKAKGIQCLHLSTCLTSFSLYLTLIFHELFHWMHVSVFERDLKGLCKGGNIYGK